MDKDKKSDFRTRLLALLHEAGMTWGDAVGGATIQQLVHRLEDKYKPKPKPTSRPPRRPSQRVAPRKDDT